MRQELHRQMRAGARRIDADRLDEVHLMAARQKELTMEAHRAQQAIMSSFKSEKSKFSGELEENLEAKLRDYHRVCDNNIREPEHDQELRIRYFYLMLTGEAKEFFYTNVDGMAETYEQVLQMMKGQYLNDTVQERCHTELEKLDLGEVMKSNNMTVPKALNYIRDRIVTLNSLGPEDRKTENLRRDYMHNAVKGHSWATNTLSRAKTGKWPLNQLYQQLDSDWQLAQDVQQRKQAMRGKAVHPRVYYTGQGMYGKPRQPGSRSSVPGSEHRSGPAGNDRRWDKAKVRFQNKEFTGKCFNCLEPGHIMAKCTKPKRGVLKNVHSALSKAPMHQVLFELSMQAEDPMEVPQEEEDQNKEGADVDEFQALYESHMSGTGEAGPSEDASQAQDAVDHAAIVKHYNDQFPSDFDESSDEDMDYNQDGDDEMGF